MQPVCVPKQIVHARLSLSLYSHFSFACTISQCCIKIVPTIVFPVPQVIAESLSEEEIAGLREMFKAMDTDNSGAITFDELKAGLRKYGSTLKDTEIRDLMDAVRQYVS